MTIRETIRPIDSIVSGKTKIAKLAAHISVSPCQPTKVLLPRRKATQVNYEQEPSKSHPDPTIPSIWWQAWRAIVVELRV